jgi:hypothetical protein
MMHSLIRVFGLEAQSQHPRKDFWKGSAAEPAARIVTRERVFVPQSTAAALCGGNGL